MITTLKFDLVEQTQDGESKWVLRMGNSKLDRPIMYRVREWAKEPTYPAYQRAVADVIRLAELFNQITQEEADDG